MMPNGSFQFQMSGRLHFGPGCRAQLPAVLLAMQAEKVLIVTDAGLVKAGLCDQISGLLDQAGILFEIYDRVEPDPRVEIVGDCTEAAKAANASVIIGFGGGSPLDIAKMTAIMMTNGGEPLDYAGINQVPKAGLPMIAIPTTAGTGSEVTPIAVLSDKASHLKKGVVSPYLYPSVALVDPELALNLPARITAYTGMDALTHCIEAYTNRFAVPFIDVFAKEGIRLISQSIRRAVLTGNDIQARCDLAMGSLYGGMCLGAVNTAAVHALAYPLGGTYDVPHGLANTLLLPHVMKWNVPADIPKYADIAQLMGMNLQGLSPREAATASIEAVSLLAKDLIMDLRLRDFDIPESAIPEMAEGAMLVTRLMNNNPRTLSRADCAAIYQAAY